MKNQIKSNQTTCFYIMRDSNIVSTPRKVSLQRIVQESNTCTIISATRHYGVGKTSQVHIVGSQGEYGVDAGDEALYTIDTGNGYRHQNSRLEIDHIYQVVNGIVTHADGKPRTDGLLPEGENRNAYVMK